MSDGFVLLETRDQPGQDPLDTQQASVAGELALTYGRLVDVVRNPQGDQSDVKIVPSFSTEGYEFSSDKMKVTFKLRKGVKFQNIAPVNGREQVAEDVKYSINRYMTDDKSTFKARFADIKSIEAPDNYTVVFNLKAPSRYILDALKAEPSFITPKELAATEGGFTNKIVGAGPFIFESYKAGEGRKNRKNTDFIDASKIYYNRFDIKVVLDAQTRIAAVASNQADAGATGISRKDAQANQRPTVKQYQEPVVATFGLWFNMTASKWKDYRARMAIARAFDQKVLIDQVFQSDGTLNGIVPTGFGDWALSSKELATYDAYKYDPAEAAKLWAAAGKPATSNQYYVMPKAVFPAQSLEAELIGGMVEKNLGVKPEYKSDDYSVFLPNGYNGKWDDLCVFGYGVGGTALDYLLLPYYPKGARNGPRLNDPKVTAMLDDIRGTLDDTEAKKKSRDAQKHILENVLSMVHLPVLNSFALYNSKLENFLPGLYPYGYNWILTSWKTK